ncbi:hypothetical protein PFISCL1PPCAC_11258, partial [Pristionchus fissidentatus]
MIWIQTKVTLGNVQVTAIKVHEMKAFQLGLITTNYKGQRSLSLPLPLPSILGQRVCYVQSIQHTHQHLLRDSTQRRVGALQFDLEFFQRDGSQREYVIVQVFLVGQSNPLQEEHQLIVHALECSSGDIHALFSRSSSLSSLIIIVIRRIVTPIQRLLAPYLIFLLLPIYSTSCRRSRDGYSTLRGSGMVVNRDSTATRRDGCRLVNHRMSLLVNLGQHGDRPLPAHRTQTVLGQLGLNRAIVHRLEPGLRRDIRPLEHLE